MARYINEEPGLQTYVEEVERQPVLDRDEELALAQRWRVQRDPKARDALIQSHLRSVVKIARRYRGYGIYLSDLVAEGNLGLIEAAKRFEPERGLRFLTYARYWIRAFILGYVLKHWSIVDMGSTALQSKLFFRLQAEHGRLVGELGESDDTIESRLAAKFHTSEDHVRSSLQRLVRRDASLDVPLGSDAALTHLDLLRDSALDQETRFASAEISWLVQSAIAEIWPTLDRRERLIVESRLLPDDGDAKTLAALGRQMGVTRERVRQLEVGVKDKLRDVFTRMLSRDAALGAMAEAAAA
jgi:RNA polymerase sigma-32 factor